MGISNDLESEKRIKEQIEFIFIMAALLLFAVFGGWFLMDKLLSAKEKQILSQTGQVAIPSVIEDSENGGADGEGQGNNQSAFTGKVLSEEEIAKVLSVWEAGGREIPHEPLEGQMSMEQAIEKGNWWIANMAKEEVLPDEMLTGDFDSTTAKLYTLENETDIEMQMLSMWEITYKKDDVTIDMKIHAWSGEVWMADITMDEEIAAVDACSEEEMLDSAFPSFSWKQGGIAASIQDGLHYEVGPNGSVYVMLQKYDKVPDNSHSGFCLWLATKAAVENDGSSSRFMGD
ncbi:MAG: hypothetical protein NC347_14870 [Clostridium sp.]|nr:hypothetical protein [Clostridium sp.]